MATSLELLGLLFIVLVNTAATALATRFFRVRLKTGWGSAVYTALLVPVLLVVLTLAIGSLGVGPDLGSAAAVFGVTVILPMAVGVAFDYFWMPAPDEVDLPEQYRDRDSQPRRSR
ncbi:hypothetical protein [Salinirussus salinus]|jgi:hypothetical protein|uniref:hypothetical protein n=1 Tax=Salinirussus salinus TaxID=1198300 RepID=UPI0013591DCA|nr:hypothetical protein [Salinirussus salinus]